MMKRLFDIGASLVSLVFLGPLILIAAVGVRLSSKGPAFYKTQRAGVNGVPFTLYKLRTMRIDQGAGASAVTSAADPRVFAFGGFLRKTKIDELPQLWNILIGDMTIVGPRPEDLSNVERYYDDLAMSTLAVRPGLSGVGSIYNYTTGEQLLTGENTEHIYATQLLPVKIALEAVYIRDATFWYDLQIIFRTVVVIARIAAGQKEFDDPVEMPEAQKLLANQRLKAAA